MAVKQSVGDKIAEKVVNGYNGAKKFVETKTSEKSFEETVVSVGDTIVTGVKKAGDFCVEKVFGREGETVDETKARIRRGEFSVEADKETDEIIIEESPADTTNEQ